MATMANGVDNNSPLITTLEGKGITMLYEIRSGEGHVTPTAYIFESQKSGLRTIISHQLCVPVIFNVPLGF